MQNIPDQYKNFKSGYVAIAGTPNAGKSTLLNRMLGDKISITSKKPQTTRNRILGVLHRNDVQIVFFDTPGVFEARDKLNVRIVDAALSAVGDADIILVVVDIANPEMNAERFLIKQLKNQVKPVILALNKIDLIDTSRVLENIDDWSKAFEFKDIVPISARHGIQVDELIAAMAGQLPP
ncbi:GTPase Era, partial [Alkalispirochaeta odontotermitis]